MFRQKIQKWKKSLGAAAVLALVAGGVAFALLMSQASLTGNSIHTESAELLISQNDSDYGPTTTGYDFSGIIPGTQASQTEHFFLKNVGSAPLALKLALNSIPTNPQSVDLSRVNVIITPSNNTYFRTTQTFSLQSLIDAGDAGLDVTDPAEMQPGAKEGFNIQVAIDDDTVTSAGASLSNIDLGFTGTAVGNGN